MNYYSVILGAILCRHKRKKRIEHGLFMEKHPKIPMVKEIITILIKTYVLFTFIQIMLILFYLFLGFICGNKITSWILS